MGVERAMGKQCGTSAYQQTLQNSQAQPKHPKQNAAHHYITLFMGIYYTHLENISV